MGRSSIFLNNLNNWKQNKILLVDKSISTSILDGHIKQGKAVCKFDHTNYHKKPRIESSAYTNEEGVKLFAKINDSANLNFMDYDAYAKSDISFDLLYSFQSVGYHYSIHDAIESLKLFNKAKDGAYLIFGVRSRRTHELNDYEIPCDIGEMFKFIEYLPGQHRQDFIIFQKNKNV